jgi:hypothetical protein
MVYNVDRKRGKEMNLKPNSLYRLYKEGKLDITKEEMNALYKWYQGLSPYQTDDRGVIDTYLKYWHPAIVRNDQEMIPEIIEKVKSAAALLLNNKNPNFLLK